MTSSTTKTTQERCIRPNDSMSVFKNIQQVRDLLEEDRRCSIVELCSRLHSPDCSKTSVWRSVYEVPGLRKLSCRWVLRILTETHTTDHLGAALNFLTAYHLEGEGLLDRIIMGGEMWAHHYIPELKQASMMWCDPGMKVLKKAKTGKSAGKAIAIVFWDTKGIILNYYIPSSIMVNSVYYCKVLRELKVSLHRELWESNMFLFHDNER